MTSGLQLTSLSDVRPGMILSDVLFDDKGNVLLAQGVVLTETLLASLARHGVDAVPILQAAAPAQALDPASVQARLDYLFRSNDREDNADWATCILRRYVEDYRLQREVAA